VLALPTDRKLRRAAIVGHLGGKCAYCGYDQELELDHKDPFTRARRGSISKMSKTRIIAELPLLQVLCRDCHLVKSRYDREAKCGQRPHWEHGTTTGYYCHRCRCLFCMDAMRTYLREKKACTP
jgi:hypothetical protein